MIGTYALPQGVPNSILRVIIENMLYPITIDVLHQVSRLLFSMHHNLMTLISFYGPLCELLHMS